MGAAESREFTRRELLLLYSLLQAHQDNLTALGKPLPKQSKTAQDASGKLWEAPADEEKQAMKDASTDRIARAIFESK